jgi:precorrin-4 methylase
VTSAESLQNALLKSMPSDTPVAVVHNASGPDQRSVMGSLSALHTLIRQAGMESPAIILVGDVLKTITDYNSVINDSQEIYAIAVRAS